MKFKKADTDILFEAFVNGSCVHGTKCDLFGSYIGAVEFIVSQDEEGGYITELYQAIQLPTGEILAIGDGDKAIALHGCEYRIHWGVYPADFPEEKKTTRPCPKSLKPRYEVLADCAGICNEAITNNLPF